MRQTISGLIVTLAAMTASAVPAMACGGLFQASCWPCGQAYVGPCAQPEVYVAPLASYAGCDVGCGGWAFDRLSDPAPQYYSDRVQQYYYVNQGPTYTGPGAFAPFPTYQEAAVSGRDAYRFRAWRRHAGYHHGARIYSRYGYMRHR